MFLAVAYVMGKIRSFGDRFRNWLKTSCIFIVKLLSQSERQGLGISIDYELFQVEINDMFLEILGIMVCSPPPYQ